MVLLTESKAQAAIKTFGGHDSNDPLSTRWTVPLASLRQAAIAESLIESIVADGADNVETSAIVCLSDWSIYYEYQLRMFWKMFDYELLAGKRPEFTAVYWPKLDALDIAKIKSSFFIMMAFEFSGSVLFNHPGVRICIDDGELITSSASGRVRDGLIRIMEHSLSGPSR